MGWITLIPAFAAVGIAVWRKDVFLALPIAIWLSETLIAGYNPAAGLLASIDRLAEVFTSEGNARVILFCILVGGLIALMQRSGGVSAFVALLTRSGAVNSPRRAGLFAWALGLFLFVETNLSLLGSGVASRGLFDHFKLSRARLAYIIDSTSAPVSVILMFNAWGAFVLGLIAAQPTVSAPVPTLVGAAALNFYAILALLMALFVAASGRAHFTLRRHEERAEAAGGAADMEVQEAPTKARYMLVPMAVLIALIFFFMWRTGDGNILQGSGSRSILWAMSIAALVAILMLVFERRYSFKEAMAVNLDGMAHLLPAVGVLVLAIALSASFQDLGVGAFVASVVSPETPGFLVTPLVFLAACVIAFTTGTSWGTFAIMIPIAMPLAPVFDLPAALVLAAILGGGVFGDHCSPISDTTVVASLAAGVDHVDHVRTQLPYALIAGAAATVLYALAGLLLGGG